MPQPHLILASTSPRRRELLSRLGLPFTVIAPTVEEEAPSQAGRPERLARRLAAAKARAVAAAYPQAIVLAADTAVARRGEILGKPQDATEAAEMLRRLRGRAHRVATAVAVVPPGRRPLMGHAVTRVVMRRYSDEEIAASIARGDPFDKAGAYGIQDGHLRPVARYEGCYCNVVGLPLWLALRLLARAGLEVSHPSAAGLPPECGACPLAPPQGGGAQAAAG